MTYSIELLGPRCPNCDRRPESPYVPQPYYNLSAIFDFALTGEVRLPIPPGDPLDAMAYVTQTDRPTGLRILSGKRGSETIELLEAAIARSHAPEQQAAFITLEPPNKWGDLRLAIRVMGALLAAAKDYPDYIWDID